MFDKDFLSWVREGSSVSQNLPNQLASWKNDLKSLLNPSKSIFYPKVSLFWGTESSRTFEIRLIGTFCHGWEKGAWSLKIFQINWPVEKMILNHCWTPQSQYYTLKFHYFWVQGPKITFFKIGQKKIHSSHSVLSIILENFL